MNSKPDDIPPVSGSTVTLQLAANRFNKVKTVLKPIWKCRYSTCVIVISGVYPSCADAIEIEIVSAHSAMDFVRTQP